MIYLSILCFILCAGVNQLLAQTKRELRVWRTVRYSSTFDVAELREKLRMDIILLSDLRFGLFLSGAVILFLHFVF